MVFSSVTFVFVFLPLVLSAYFLLRGKWINALLLLSSLLFYVWGEGLYILILIISIFGNYYFSLFIQKERDKNNAQRCRKVLVASLVFNLILLFIFKYLNFAVVNLDTILSWAGTTKSRDINLHLPLGISFFTFQAISYVLDVYRGDVKACKSIFRFAVYRSLFPVLIAGPIVRYKDVASQLIKRSVTAENFAEGVIRFVMGLGKKVLIANQVALVADEIFSLPVDNLTFGKAWLGIICYTTQIYFDFSGYSDMAIGMGKMFGFTFLENFNYPYISKSIREFWRRWHISLSTWLRDYLYIPLGGNKYGWARTSLNLLIVFFLCGLWHGASWTFVIWGLWHGLFLIIERSPLNKSLIIFDYKPLSHAYAILVIMTGWVFFRADTLSYALVYLKTMYGFGNNDLSSAYMYFDSQILISLLAGVIGSTPLFSIVSQRLKIWASPIKEPFWKKSFEIYSPIRLALVVSVFILSTMSLYSGTHNPFIYFRF